MNTLHNLNSEEDLNSWIINDFKSKGIKNIIIDGTLNKEVYENQKIKILFIYLETYGYDNCGIVRISEEFEGWMKATWQTRTFRYCSLFVKIILELTRKINNKEPILEYSKSSMQNMYQDFDSLLDSMKKTAFINLRKTSNDKADANYQKIDQEVNNELILKQIEILNPDIIITGGKYACNKFNQLNYMGKRDFKYNEILEYNEKCIASINHLSRPRYKKMYDDAIKIAKMITNDNRDFDQDKINFNSN